MEPFAKSASSRTSCRTTLGEGFTTSRMPRRWLTSGRGRDPRRTPRSHRKIREGPRSEEEGGTGRRFDFGLVVDRCEGVQDDQVPEDAPLLRHRWQSETTTS